MKIRLRGRTDGHDEANSIVFRNFEKAPKMNRVKNNEIGLQIDMFILTLNAGSYWINGSKN
jgi:hypothetical protein